MSHEAAFDQFADDYDSYIEKGLRLAGESKEHFAQARVNWVRDRVQEWHHPVDQVLDFGCGTGVSTPMLRDSLGASDVLGVDPSARSLDLANTGAGLRYATNDQWLPDGSRDLAFTNGVFHHIPLDEQSAAVAYLRDAVVPGGLVALWENNPYNPATRYGMRMNAFDRGCKMVWPARARSLLADSGLKVIRADFLFVFPHALRGLRWIEPRISRMPIGGQYCVIAQRA